MPVPESRLRPLNQAGVRHDGDFVLYWMTAFRRTRCNFSLQHAVDLAARYEKRLVIFEAIRCDYRWASDRFHQFVLDGMLENAVACARHNVTYIPFVEASPGAGKGAIDDLAERASVVVCDDYPGFFLREMTNKVGSRLTVKAIAVDSNGLIPIHLAKKAYSRAFDFRRFMHKTIAHHPDEFFERFPDEEPLQAYRGGQVDLADFRFRTDLDAITLSQLPIDHSVAPSFDGGPAAARKQLANFVRVGFGGYAEDRSHPDKRAASGLSPFLHFGHLSAHEIARKIFELEEASPEKLDDSAISRRRGFWGLSENAESFLDELITWREVGFNGAVYVDGYDTFQSLPDWALKTIAEHADDERPIAYTLSELEHAATEDDIWNAAQRELVQTGRMQNYLRMLWGKRVYEWTRSPKDAFDRLVHLNNKYAVDGRDPNSYCGIGWVFGRYDRAWGPERPIFGKLRYMTSQSTRRKLRLAEYLKKFGPDSE